MRLILKRCGEEEKKKENQKKAKARKENYLSQTQLALDSVYIQDKTTIDNWKQ